MSKVQKYPFKLQPLETVARFIRGITFTPEDKVAPSTEGAVVCMRTANVQDVLDESDLIAIPENFVKRDEQFLLESDILVSTANSWNLVGKCSWVPKLTYLATAGGFISILRADRTKVFPRYLYYWFASDKTQHDVRLCGRQTTNISNMSFERCLALEVPLPPLSEQKRIVDILDKADAIRRKRQEALKFRRQFLKSTFLEMFGDPATNPQNLPLRELKEFYVSPKEGTKCGPFGGALKKEEYVSAGVPVWNMDNISDDGSLVPDIRLWISEEKYEDLSSYSVKEGDIIISRAGTVGKMCVVRAELKKSIISTNLIRLRLNSFLVPEFFVSLMVFLKGRSGRLKTGPDGTFTHMSTGVLDNLTFPYPSVGAQRDYVSIIKQVDHSTSLLKNAVSEADCLFSSLVQRAYKGML